MFKKVMSLLTAVAVIIAGIQFTPGLIKSMRR